MSRTTFKNLVWVLFYYTLIVILWGAWVRISHSGDGCGDTWPLCGGKLIPQALQQKTWVEYGHRLMSGIFGIYVFVLYFYSRRVLEKSHPSRKWMFLALIFTFSEAMLGAKLVLFGLVGNNSSPYRLFIMSLHQLNSFLLTGFVFLAAYQLSVQSLKLSFKSLKAASLFLLISVSGALAALASTLFPSTSLLEGFGQDFADDSHFILRLRILHPLFAITLTALLAFYFYQVSQKASVSLIQKTNQTIQGLFIGVCFGIFTLISLSPSWMKLSHLLIGHLLWALVLRLCVRINEENSKT